MMARACARGLLALILVLGILGTGCGKGKTPGSESRRERAERLERDAYDDERRDEHADAREHGENHEDEAMPHVELSPEAVKNARIEVGVAAPAGIATTVSVPGEVHLNAERVLEVRPRYPGVLRDIRKRIGDKVARGEVVAVVQSNESLTDYEIESSMAGTVIARSVVAGQAVDHGTVLYVIADLSTVWVDFAIYPQYVGRVRPGIPVRITAHTQPPFTAESRVDYVGPLLEQDTRVSSARVTVENRDGRWQPGLFVTARLLLDRKRVPVAVPEGAIVRTASGPGVFRARGNRYELAPVEAGLTDGAFTQIRSGIAAGDSIVVANAFVLKAELGKGEAAHEH